MFSIRACFSGVAALPGSGRPGLTGQSVFAPFNQRNMFKTDRIYKVLGRAFHVLCGNLTLISNHFIPMAIPVEKIDIWMVSIQP